MISPAAFGTHDLRRMFGGRSACVLVETCHEADRCSRQKVRDKADDAVEALRRDGFLPTRGMAMGALPQRQVSRHQGVWRSERLWRKLAISRRRACSSANSPSTPRRQRSARLAGSR